MNEVTERRNPAQIPVTPLAGGRRSGDAPSSKGFGWWPALVLVLLTAVAATTALITQQLTVSRAANAVPNEGFYWSVAQYQIAHHRLKQELRAVAAGEPVNAPELSRRAAVLASRVSILTEPSEVKSLLNAVPGYVDATRRVAELQSRVGPILEKGALTQADATQVLALFQAAGDDELLSQLASDVRMAEINAKEAMAQSVSRRIGWIWGGFAFCWGALAFWLLYAIRSRRRYRAAAHDRQRAVEAMEQALVAKRRFLSMVNHEVRSPLQNIVASAELLAMKDNRPDSVAAIRRIRYAVTVLQGQLRDLLTIARGDSAQLPTQVETFEFGELVQDVCAGLEDAAVAKGLSFEVEFPPLPVNVSADPIRIAQVLRNLVENAVRYTTTGRVRVRVESFESRDRSDHGQAVKTDPRSQDAPSDFSVDGMLRFVVHDSGPGLPPSAAESLVSRAQRYALGQLTHLASISVHYVPDNHCSALAEVVGKPGCVLWASRDMAVGVPGDAWGQAGSSVLVRGYSATSMLLGVAQEFKADLPAEVSPAAGRIEIRTELNGLADGFGEKLLERLATAVRGPLLDGEADIKAVIYRDRYLNAPLPVSLLISLIGAIKARYQSRWDNPVIEVVSVALPEDGRAFPVPTQVFHNWQSTHSRDSAISAAFVYRGMEAVVRNLPKPMASHARTLEIGLADGKKLKVWLDQGFGFWSTPRSGSRAAQASSTWFGFSEEPSWQGEEIGEGRYAIEGQSFPTHVFFEKV